MSSPSLGVAGAGAISITLRGAFLRWSKPARGAYLTLRVPGAFRGVVEGREVAHRTGGPPYIEDTQTIYGAWHIRKTTNPLRYVEWGDISHVCVAPKINAP